MKNLNKSHIIELEDIAPLFNSSKELTKNMFKTDYGKDLFDLYKYYNNDDEFINEAYLHERFLRDKECREISISEKSKAQGIAEGEVKEKLNIAKNMVSEGCDLELIAKCTGLSLEEIETLCTKNNN